MHAGSFLGTSRSCAGRGQATWNGTADVLAIRNALSLLQYSRSYVSMRIDSAALSQDFLGCEE